MDTTDLHAPLVEQGRRLFEIFAPGATLETLVLDDGAGICMMHAVRGGGKIFVEAGEKGGDSIIRRAM